MKGRKRKKARKFPCRVSPGMKKVSMDKNG
jgi:hypothetical protein